MKEAPVEEITVETLFQPKASPRRRSWYLDRKNLRPPTQFKWSVKERALLYNMRVVKNLPIATIQRFFRKRNGIPVYLGADDNNDKFSRTRLHNQIRIVRGSLNGLCHKCRSPLTKADLKRINRRRKEDPSMGLCKKCYNETSEYKKEKRIRALKEGFCAICCKRKVIPGHTMCKKCLSASHRYRYLEDLCGRCGEHPLADNSISLCKGCLKINRDASREYRRQKRQRNKGSK